MPQYLVVAAAPTFKAFHHVHRRSIHVQSKGKRERVRLGLSTMKTGGPCSQLPGHLQRHNIERSQLQGSVRRNSVLESESEDGSKRWVKEKGTTTRRDGAPSDKDENKRRT